LVVSHRYALSRLPQPDCGISAGFSLWEDVPGIASGFGRGQTHR
jgi:hypothetical protein